MEKRKLTGKTQKELWAEEAERMGVEREKKGKEEERERLFSNFAATNNISYEEAADIVCGRKSLRVLFPGLFK